MNKISSVSSNSIAKECGLECGDCVITINGKEIEDILDYRYEIANEELLLEILKADGNTEMIEVYNDFEDIGVNLEGLLETKSCHNKCVFCFIDQLPPKLRNTLYVKDDDYRMSVLMGNYVTLTNMKDADFKRLVKFGVPQINISVHTTDDELRCKMLNNKNASGILDKISYFAKHNINMNCQIVLCPGFNDGEYLWKTIYDLSEFSPFVQSVSVVPVGLTKYRENLVNVRKFTKDMAIKTVKQVERIRDDLLEKIGTRFIHLGDEFYVLSGMPLPSYECYEDFLQLENGVGMLRTFEDEFMQDNAVSTAKNTLVTGESAYDFLVELTKNVAPNLEIIPIKNEFFGGEVSVTGLVVATDIINQLKGKDLKNLIIPRVMLNYDNVFLDDKTVLDIENELHVKVKLIGNHGGEFRRIICND